MTLHCSQVKVVVICNVQPAAVLVSSCDCALMWHRDVLHVAEPCTPTKNYPLTQRAKGSPPKRQGEGKGDRNSSASVKGTLKAQKQAQTQVQRQSQKQALKLAQRQARRARSVHSAAFVPDPSFTLPPDEHWDDSEIWALRDLDL